MGKGSAGGGESLGGGSAENINIVSQTDVWTFRHRQKNEAFVDSMNDSVRTVQEDFPGLMDDVKEVNSAVLGGADKQNTLGFYGNGQLALNSNYTNVDKMNKVYDEAVKEGYPPGRGNKNGTEAVTFHELGHAVTDHVKDKVGAKDIDGAAKIIVDNAYKNANGRGGTKAWAGKISGYAQKNNAECIAEAVADWYCNGNKASKQSKSIMAELKKYS